MKKILIIIIALPFLAASCDIFGGVFDFNTGPKGVFKSTDGGQTYNSTSKLQGKGDISNLSINAIAFDPSNPEILYAGAGNGIYKSEDSANSWKYILSGISVASLSVDKFSPQTIYASGIVGTNGKIIKSVDSGKSWVDIYSEPSKNNTVLAVAVSNSNSSLVLAGLNNGEIIRSSDQGRTWQSAGDFQERVMEINFGPNSAYALTTRKGLHRSQDLGQTWIPLGSAMSSETFNSSNQSTSAVSGFYDLALDLKQLGVLYLGTEQGLYRSMNDGLNWSFMPLPVKNASLRVSAVAVSPSNSNHIFATVGNTVFKSVNGGVTWESKILPTSFRIRVIEIDSRASNIIYLGLKNE